MKSIILMIMILGAAMLQGQSQTYSTLYNKAVEAIGKKEYEPALKYLNDAIEQKGDFAEAIFARGTCFLMLNQRDNACNDFLTAEKLAWKPATEYRGKYCSPDSPGRKMKPVKPAVTPGDKTH